MQKMCFHFENLQLNFRRMNNEHLRQATPTSLNQWFH